MSPAETIIVLDVLQFAIEPRFGSSTQESDDSNSSRVAVRGVPWGCEVRGAEKRSSIGSTFAVP